MIRYNWRQVTPSSRRNHPGPGASNLLMVDKPSSDLPAAILYDRRIVDMRGLYREGPPGPPIKPPRAGDVCQRCKARQLEYDGTLNLACPECGVVAAGCFT